MMYTLSHRSFELFFFMVSFHCVNELLSDPLHYGPDWWPHLGFNVTHCVSTFHTATLTFRVLLCIPYFELLITLPPSTQYRHLICQKVLKHSMWWTERACNFFFFKEQVINTTQYMALLTKTSCVWLCRFREGEVGAVRSHCSSAHPHPCCADEAAELWFMTAYLIRCSGVHLQHVGVPWVKPLISCKDTWVTSVEDFFFFLKKMKKKMQRTHFHFVLFEVLLHVVCFHSIMEPAVALTSVNYHFISH